MRLAVIADDLTGANDTGVQLVKRGFSTTVCIDPDQAPNGMYEAVVYDTDSRVLPAAKAYAQVKRIAERIRSEWDEQPEIVYKKIDSTMRGRVGAELDAVYDVFGPDFIVITPAFPENGRIVREGTLFVNGVPVHETEAGRDTQAPVKESDVLKLLRRETARHVALITLEDLHLHQEAWQAKLKQFKDEGIVYLVVDATQDEHLYQAVELFLSTDYRIVWSGSAGLAKALTAFVQPVKSRDHTRFSPIVANRILFVVGSTHSRSRRQLDELLAHPDVSGIEFNIQNRLNENRSFVDEAVGAFQIGHHVVLYSSSETVNGDLLLKSGQDRGAVSRAISAQLGTMAARIVEEGNVDALVMTGGDTAKQVCKMLGCAEMELDDELETGVPIGRLQSDRLGGRTLYAVTKAGGFGTDSIWIQVLQYFGGGNRA